MPFVTLAAIDINKIKNLITKEEKGEIQKFRNKKAGS